MPPRRKKFCLKCYEPQYLEGLCRQHYSENQEDISLRTAGRDLIGSRLVDGLPIDNLEIMAEFNELSKRFTIVCSVVNFQHGRDTLPLDEAPAAIDWCILWATELVERVRKQRQGCSFEYESYPMRDHARERFANLDKGLMSNGLPRCSED